MRASLIAAAGLAAFAGSSSLAADLVVPPVQPAAEFSWTAIMQGGNLGGLWGQNSRTVIGWGQVGYNWQYRWLLVGAEKPTSRACSYAVQPSSPTRLETRSP